MTTGQLIAGATGSLRRRVYAKIDRSAGRRGCWRWLGATARKRDGAERPKIKVGGRGSRVVTVARLLLALRDRVPLAERESERLEAGHTCGHFWCVNVRHLAWQTRAENEQEKRDREAFEDFARDMDELAAEYRAEVAENKFASA